MEKGITIILLVFLLWVEEMKDLGDRNPILFCEISESSDNFMLAMQTPLQVATNA